jgi:hypothetical protein
MAERQGQGRRAGEAVLGLMGDSGFQSARLLDVGGRFPAVLGEIPGPEGAPLLQRDTTSIAELGGAGGKYRGAAVLYNR